MSVLLLDWKQQLGSKAGLVQALVREMLFPQCRRSLKYVEIFDVQDSFGTLGSLRDVAHAVPNMHRLSVQRMLRSSPWAVMVIPRKPGILRHPYLIMMGILTRIRADMAIPFLWI